MDWKLISDLPDKGDSLPSADPNSAYTEFYEDKLIVVFCDGDGLPTYYILLEKPV